MKRIGVVVATALVAVVGVGSGAAAAPTIGPFCKLGCIEPDPAPTAPGIFLGSGVTDEVCFAGGHTDADVDGLSDFCETNLAAAFAPELKYWRYDNVGREPHWAARPSVARVAGGGNVNIRSRAVHTAGQDCMASANPSYIYYGSGRQECDWTDRRFRGWIPTTVGGEESTAYSGILAQHGF